MPIKKKIIIDRTQKNKKDNILIEVTKDQEQFILDEAKNFDLNMNDYINVMIKIIQNHKKNINMIKLEDLDDIEDCLNLLSKQIITSTK